ncbi:MAG: hypothetical protein AAF959_21075 [Cyanobacteria bacterium P01_D01_bin.56]
MFKLISILPVAKQRKLRLYLQKNHTLLTLDTSSYGVGRQRYWLEHEPILGSGGRHYQPAVQKAQFWHFCQTIYQRANHIALPDSEPAKPDLGLVAYGKVGIRSHRDDPYAACPAVSINLSTTLTQWGYTPTYSSYEKRHPKRATEEIHHLPPGAIVIFNSQNPHRVINPDPERWSINLWRVASSCRPYFESYLTKNVSVSDNAVSFFPQAGEKHYGQQRAEGYPSWGPTVGLPRTAPRYS